MLYVLDLDDTLILERDFVSSGFRAVDAWLAAHTVITGFYDTAWALFQEGLRGIIFNQVLERSGCRYQPGLIDQMVNVYRNHRPEIALLPDAEEFLKRSGRDNTALITDGYPEIQWNKIDALGLQQYIDNIVVTGDWGRAFWKPHTRAFVHVSREHSSHECMYIGDNPEKDFIAPRKLGWATSVRVKRLMSLHYDLPTPSHCTQMSSLCNIL